MNKLANADPLPVYHSIVNPGALHNARQEYSLVKNELLIVKQENELLKKRIKDYEDIGVTNQRLEQKLTNMATLAAATGSERVIRAKNESKFSMVELNEKLAKARLKTTVDENSFMNTLKEKSQLYKSSIMNALNKSGEENDSPSDNGDEWKTIDAYITELPEN